MAHRVPKELGYGILALRGHGVCGCTECPAQPATCPGGIQHCMYGTICPGMQSEHVATAEPETGGKGKGSTQEGAPWACLVHT